jgi:hypothetical protein
MLINRFDSQIVVSLSLMAQHQQQLSFSCSSSQQAVSAAKTLTKRPKPKKRKNIACFLCVKRSLMVLAENVLLSFKDSKLQTGNKYGRSCSEIQ